MASGLRVRVLDMTRERSLVAGLRAHAPMEAERDLDPGADALEGVKDRLGMVMAFWHGDALIATIRLMPSGHGVTLAEKRWADVTRARRAFGVRSWEVGRLIVAPEHRSMDLLRTCLALSLQTLLQHTDARYLHASCSPLLARLYRWFGFATESTVCGETGAPHVLIHAPVDDVARALGLALAQPATA
ncbi:N-acyl amino acid synthase FeeM domain-containing protein [Hydrogenophaga sp. BPS33]|uniref:N-acyl amino acid synthase FeeM domain-containing protein n=1 Tax=Hydrogenophaga sp. BPS33 TaxID=2651974 RepID=UPI00131F975D|nr:hypothetical protein [Hydrogenophaga sp. BPS33]QHE87584.1 hypothetical protein F9K07_23145 [Hydrogenophaga sp. BPS33]